MKKIVSVLAFAVLLVSVSFAIETSAGAGLKFTNTMGNFEATLDPVTMTAGSNVSEIALNGFFDATYIELDLGYSMVMNASVYSKMEGAGPFNYDITTDLEGSMSYLTIGALGKYPVALGFATIFPLLGAEYKLNLTAKDKDGEDLKADMTSEEKADLNQIWLKAGVGADFNITPKLYVRPSALFGYKLQNDEEKKMVTDAEDGGMKASFNTIRFDIGASVGFKL